MGDREGPSRLTLVLWKAKKIPVLAFVDPAVKLEGAMTSLIVNPRPIPPAARLARSVSEWLAEAEFADSSSEAFLPKWEKLTEPARMVVAALLLLDEGCNNAKQSSDKKVVAKRFSIDALASDQALQDAKLQFTHPEQT